MYIYDKIIMLDILKKMTRRLLLQKVLEIEKSQMLHFIIEPIIEPV